MIVFSNTISFSQNCIVRGKVKHDKDVLQSATVSLGDKTILTDHNGEFSFSVKPGNYSVVITHTGYKKIEHSITVDAGSKRSFEFNMEPTEQLGEIVVLGSRSLIQRSNLNSAVPVDAFSSAQLQQTGQTSLMQMLNFTAPSIRTSQPLLTEPITLRGLDPDHTLILLNSTRYHNIAYLNPGTLGSAQLGRGSVGNDLNTIPFSAIEKVEILRDGATAQYGSDAIAGVINVLLKKSIGTSVNLHLGQQYEGDGENILIGIYRGIDLNKKGFLSVSADLRCRFPTFRQDEYQGTVYKTIPPGTPYADSIRIRLADDSIIRARGFDRMNATSASSSRLTSLGYLINGGYHVSRNTELFWTSALNYLNLVFLTGYTFPRNPKPINTELHPDGFQSRAIPVIWNISVIAGVRGMTRRKTHWEFSSAYGLNTDQFISDHTNNASQQYTLGKNAQTKFYTGNQTYQQLTNTIQFTKQLPISRDKLKVINLGWGAELRCEYFNTKAGEEASWKNYDAPLYRKNGSAHNSQLIYPDDVVYKNRHVICAYADMETELNDRFLINLASRFEHYNDFGGNLAGKLAARYKLFNKLSLRGSVSNGFRAPSMQQRYFSLVTFGTRPVVGGGTTGAKRGIFNNDHPVTKIFGVPSLEAEKSVNLSGGLTSTISQQIYLTIDAYWIQIKNRIILSGNFDRFTNPQVDSLLKDPSLINYSNVDIVSFFANAINTRTQGIDVVIHGKWQIRKVQLIAILAGNFNQTRLFGDIKVASNLPATDVNKNTLFTNENKAEIETGSPRNKFILSLNFKKEKFGFLIRNTRFDKVIDYNTGGTSEVNTPKILTDVSISYSVKSWLILTGGANNVFDVYPNRIKNYVNTNEGRLIYTSSHFGNSGGYYFLSMNFNL
jgi:iron complex outermembrane receptor protein